MYGTYVPRDVALAHHVLVIVVIIRDVPFADCVLDIQPDHVEWAAVQVGVGVER